MLLTFDPPGICLHDGGSIGLVPRSVLLVVSVRGDRFIGIESHVTPAPTFKTMAALADSTLFRAVISIQHGVFTQAAPNMVLGAACVKSAFSSHTAYNLRPRSHPYELPDSDSRIFLPCKMYQGIY